MFLMLMVVYKYFFVLCLTLTGNPTVFDLSSLFFLFVWQQSPEALASSPDAG